MNETHQAPVQRGVRAGLAQALRRIARTLAADAERRATARTVAVEPTAQTESAAPAPQTPPAVAAPTPGPASRWAPPAQYAATRVQPDAAEPDLPFEREPGTALVDPLERTRAALQDARRQMSGLLDERRAPRASVAWTPVGDDEGDAAPGQWLGLLAQLREERRQLAGEVGALRDLVLELRGEVGRLTRVVEQGAVALPPAAGDPAALLAPTNAGAEAASPAAPPLAADEYAPAVAEVVGLEARAAAPPPPDAASGAEAGAPLPLIRAAADAVDDQARPVAEPATAPLIQAEADLAPQDGPAANAAEATPALPAAATVAGAESMDEDAAIARRQRSAARDFGWRLRPEALAEPPPAAASDAGAPAEPATEPSSAPPGAALIEPAFSAEDRTRVRAVTEEAAASEPGQANAEPPLLPVVAGGIRVTIAPLRSIGRLTALERRLVQLPAVARLTLIEYRRQTGAFLVTLHEPAPPETLLAAVCDEAGAIADWAIADDGRALRIALGDAGEERPA